MLKKANAFHNVYLDVHEFLVNMNCEHKKEHQARNHLLGILNKKLDSIEKQIAKDVKSIAS